MPLILSPQKNKLKMKKLFTLIALGLSSAAFAQSGNITGKVYDVNGIPLPGAHITLTESEYHTLSNLEGAYKLIDVEAGKYEFQVSFVGYENFTDSIEILADQTIENIVKLKVSANELDMVYVTATQSGQAISLSNQKNNINVTNVVSADQTSKFPDMNAGETVRRLPGITIQNDQGEARNIIIRGVSPALNNVQVNGERIPSAEGDNRNVQMDLIPADMIQSIEVSKTITPDMQGDAIGGTVNLVTRASNEGQRLSLTGGSGVSMFNNEPIWNGAIVYGNRFFDNKLGAIVSGSIYDVDYGSDNVEFEWDYDGDNPEDSVYVAEEQIRQYYVRRLRKSATATLDYQFNPANSIYFKGIYSNRKDWENRYRLVYKDMGYLEGGTTEAEVERQTKGGSSDNDNRRLENQTMWNTQLGGQHIVGTWEIDWKASRAVASEERPNERYIQFVSGEVLPVNVNMTDPSFVVTNPINYGLTEGELMEVDEISEENQFTQEENWVARLDLTKTLSQGDFSSEIKMGGRYTDKTKERNNTYTEYSDLSGDYDNMALLPSGDLVNITNPNFYAGSQYVAGNFASADMLGSLDLNDPNLFEAEDKPGEYMPVNYTANEQISAGYAMLKQGLGQKWSMIAGVRYEHTNIDYTGYSYNDDTEEASPTQGTSSYGNWLPSVHFRFQPKKNTVLRAAWSNTLARPNYYDLVPYEEILPEDYEVALGNPALEATTSMNLDFMAEQYFKSLGIISGGVFFKSIDNFIYTQTFDTLLTVDGVEEEYEAVTPVNGATAEIYGAELSLQRSLDFIPGKIWKHISLFANYTYTHSVADGIEGREDGQPLEGTAKNMVNGSLAYDNNKFQLRVSLNYTSDYVDEFGKEAFYDRYYDSQMFVDVNASYNVGQKWNIFMAATNLTNQPLRYYQGAAARTMQMEYYGPRLTAGVKLNVF